MRGIPCFGKIHSEHHMMRFTLSITLVVFILSITLVFILSITLVWRSFPCGQRLRRSCVGHHQVTRRYPLADKYARTCSCVRAPNIRRDGVQDGRLRLQQPHAGPGSGRVSHLRKGSRGEQRKRGHVYSETCASDNEAFRF